MGSQWKKPPTACVLESYNWIRYLYTYMNMITWYYMYIDNTYSIYISSWLVPWYYGPSFLLQRKEAQDEYPQRSKLGASRNPVEWFARIFLKPDIFFEPGEFTQQLSQWCGALPVLWGMNRKYAIRALMVGPKEGLNNLAPQQFSSPLRSGLAARGAWSSVPYSHGPGMS